MSQERLLSVERQREVIYVPTHCAARMRGTRTAKTKKVKTLFKGCVFSVALRK